MTTWCKTYSGTLKPAEEGVTVQLGEEPGEVLMHRGKPDWAHDPRTGAKVRFLELTRVEGTVVCPSCNLDAVKPVMMRLEADVIDPPSEWIGLDCPHCKKLSFVLVEAES